MIAAEGELQASKSLAHAARTIVECPQALQVSIIIIDDSKNQCFLNS